MTPFLEDLIQRTRVLKHDLQNSTCYFLGHKWPKWELYCNSNSMWCYSRRCKICDKMEVKT